MEPQHQRAEQEGDAKSGNPNHHDPRDPAGRLKGPGQLLRREKRESHSRDHLSEATGGTEFGHPAPVYSDQIRPAAQTGKRPEAGGDHVMLI